MKTTSILKTVVLGLSLAFATNKIIAQETTPVKKEGGNYTNAFGLRGGVTSGFTYKHRFIHNNAMEFIVGARPFAFSATGLYEKYLPTHVNGLNWYVGGGGHVGSRLVNRPVYVMSNDNNYYYRNSYSYGPAIGGDGIIGIEYKIPRAPVAFSFDLKPYFEFVRGGGTYGSLDPGLGIKLAF